MFDEFETMVQSIMAVTKCDRTKAEDTARLNGYKRSIPIEDTRDADLLEKAEQSYIMRLFREFHFKVKSTSQARRSKQGLGIPDLWCAHRELAIAFWWETKRQVGGKLSADQVEFRDDCQRCNVGYGSGDRHAARTHLIKLGLARVVGDTLEPIRNEVATCR